MPLVSGYTPTGGTLSETAALTHVLAAAGVRAPGTDQPLSEPMIFGIGGGPGAGYIMFEFHEHGTKVLVLGFHHLWQYTTRFYQNLCDRLGVTVIMPEGTGRKAADAALNNALDAGKAVVAWLDRAHLPYFQLPDALKGHIGHIAAVYGREDGDYLLDDLAAAPFRISAEDLAGARARISSYKNRLLIVEAVGPFDLPAAVRAGLAACVEHLSSDSDSFSLPTYRKWAKMMVDPKNKKGWPTLFSDRRGLYTALRSIYEGIALTNPGGLRGLYADFLHEAAPLVENNALPAVADAYNALAAEWNALAEVALPDLPFAETKQLMRERHALLMRGGDAWRESAAHTERLNALASEYNRAFPLDDAEVSRLFSTLHDRVMALYEQERAAHAMLTAAVG